MAHTPQSPEKNRVRRNMLAKCDPSKHLLTISHGLFETAMVVGWRGPIFPCDIDLGVVTAIKFIRQDIRQGRGGFTELDIRPPGYKIEDYIITYCSENGAHHLTCVDVDLAGGVVWCWKILNPVLQVLITHGYRGRTFLTFRNGRDRFPSLEERIAWLRKQLPSKVKLVEYTPYNSGRIDSYARRSKGSTMCIVELKY